MALGYGMEYYFHLRKSFYSVDIHAAAADDDLGHHKNNAH
jgi:hypothetical protein